MIRTLLKPLSFLPALMLMYMIYSFSAQPGEVSSALSYKVSYKIVQTADYIFDGGHEEWQLSQWADKINFITRKLAHMTEYFALAVAVSFPLYVYGLHGFLLMLVAMAMATALPKCLWHKLQNPNLTLGLHRKSIVLRTSIRLRLMLSRLLSRMELSISIFPSVR